MQGDRKSQQNELELVLELVGDFFGRKKKSMGAGISGGGHHGPTRQGSVCHIPSSGLLWVS